MLEVAHHPFDVLTCSLGDPLPEVFLLALTLLERLIVQLETWNGLGIVIKELGCMIGYLRWLLSK
jgi:hypothetical protein